MKELRAVLLDVEAKLEELAKEADFVADSQISWYEAKDPHTYACNIRECAKGIAEMRRIMCDERKR